MKKVLLLVGFLVFLQGCFLFDPFVNEIEVHNRFVLRLDELCEKEALFNNEYKYIFDTEDMDMMRLRFDEFNRAFLELDNFVSDTVFKSSQRSIKNEYEDQYRVFMESYIDVARMFLVDLESSGFDCSVHEARLDDLDRYTLLFYDYHNRLSDIVNSQVGDVEVLDN